MYAACVQAPGQGSRCRKPCEPCCGTNRARRCDSQEMHRCYLSRTTASVVLGRVQLPGAIPVLYSIGQEAWQAATHLAVRVAADMTVLQNHMSKGVRANGCSQCRARAGKRECHPRQEIDCTDTSADIPASGGCLFFCFEGEEIRLGRSLRAFGGDSWSVASPRLARVLRQAACWSLLALNCHRIQVDGG